MQPYETLRGYQLANLPTMKSILSLFLVSLTTALSAQLSVANTPANLLPISIQEPLEVVATTPPDLKQAFLGIGPIVSPATNATNFRYKQHLAFFCRVEAKNDKAAKMPVRFRLGSVDYVDYLEGKRDYTPRQ